MSSEQHVDEQAIHAAPNSPQLDTSTATPDHAAPNSPQHDASAAAALDASAAAALEAVNVRIQAAEAELTGQ